MNLARRPNVRFGSKLDGSFGWKADASGTGVRVDRIALECVELLPHD